MAKENTPENAEFPPKYLAIVSPEDPQAVMDLVAIVPETTQTTNPMTYKRKEGKWIKDAQILMDLKSATPPPVIELDKPNVLDDVLKQVDQLKPVEASGYYADLISYWYEEIAESLVAAGGLDRNRGNAERLRHYWTRGEGALKIRWGTPGDWTRCVRELSKYLGPRAKGYCQLRHKEVTGSYTGSKLNVGRGRKSYFTNEEEFTTSVIDTAALIAKANDAKEKFGLIASASEVVGSKFSIKLLVPEELESGDGRKFAPNSIEVRDLPLPLLWQIKTGDGHQGSVVVGRIDSIDRLENGWGNAKGVFDTSAYAREAERLVKHGFLRGVSVDLDQFEAEPVDKKKKTEDLKDAIKDIKEIGEKENIAPTKMIIKHARIMAATIVAKPAFQECAISIESDDSYMAI